MWLVRWHTGIHPSWYWSLLAAPSLHLQGWIGRRWGIPGEDSDLWWAGLQDWEDPFSRMFFRERDVFESRVIEINKCRWDRSRAITLSEWASGAHVWVSSCSAYSLLWWEDVRRERAAHTSVGHSYSGICLPKNPYSCFL